MPLTPSERRARITNARQAQPFNELDRKADKAARRRQKLWTVEELEAAKAQAARDIALIEWE